MIKNSDNHQVIAVLFADCVSYKKVRTSILTFILSYQISYWQFASQIPNPLV